MEATITGKTQDDWTNDQWTAARKDRDGHFFHDMKAFLKSQMLDVDYDLSHWGWEMTLRQNNAQRFARIVADRRTQTNKIPWEQQITHHENPMQFTFTWSRCVHCQEIAAKHINWQCPFASTHFKWPPRKPPRPL